MIVVIRHCPFERATETTPLLLSVVAMVALSSADEAAPRTAAWAAAAAPIRLDREAEGG